MTKVSIIIPVFNEEKYIASCLNSILQGTYPQSMIEIILVDGMSNDSTRKIIKRYQDENGNIRLLDNLEKVVPVAMNIGIREAQGEYIVRLDAHAEYPKNYISKLLEWSIKLDADNVGAVCQTKAKVNTPVAKAIEFVMSDKFGVGDSLFRTGVDSIKEVDTVPFGFYKREVFEKVGVYDERLVRVQDLEFNKRLKNVGGRIFLVPDTYCTYFPRETFRSFLNNRFQTGKWVVLAAYFTNNLKSISIRHFIPLLFVLSIVLSFLLGTLNPLFWLFLISILIMYTVTLYTRCIIRGQGFKQSIHNVAVFVGLHFSYGLGSMVGILEMIKQTKKGRINL